MNTISISPTLLRFGNDTFRSDRRYVRSTAGARQFVVVQGKSMEIDALVYVNEYLRAPRWAYHVDGYDVRPPHHLAFTAAAVSVTTE